MFSRLLNTLVVVLTLAVLAPVAEATHFRFGHNTWRRISDNPDGSVTVEFKFVQAWRASAPDILNLDFGDGDFYAPAPADITDVFTGSDIAGEGFIIRQYTVQHTYSASSISGFSGVFVTQSSSCCRISSLINAGDASENVAVVVNLNGGNKGSPVSNIPVILQLPVSQQASLAIAAADPEGDPMNCRLATSSESFIPSVASVGGNDLSVTSGCVLNWNLTPTTVADVGKKFAVQVVIEESNRCTQTEGGNQCGAVALDFIIELVEGNPPACVSDKPASNVVYAGVPFTASFNGSDIDPGDMLTVTMLGAPSAATLTPVSGTSGAAPLAATFSWTPTAADLNTAFSVLINYQDSRGLQNSCSLALQVSPAVLDCAGVANGSAKFDRCGVCGGDGTTCLGCSSAVNIKGTLIALDGTGAQIHQLVKKAASAYVASGGRKSTAKSLVAQSENLYLNAWAGTWTIPGVSQTCTNSTFCASANNQPVLSNIEKSNSGQTAILKKLLRSVKNARTKRNILAKETELQKKVKDFVTHLPVNTSSCSADNSVTAATKTVSNT